MLNIGPALPETVAFFSGHHCTLHFCDLFELVPLSVAEDSSQTLDERLHELLPLSHGTTLDLCLFWDLFDYLAPEVLSALVRVLRHHMHRGTRAHAFTVRNPRTPPANSIWSIRDQQSLQVRPRHNSPSGYHPHTQRQLQAMLNCFNFERSLLLENGRLELLLSAKL